MTPQQVRDALGIYEKALQGEEAVPVRGDLNAVNPAGKMQRDHLLWMCQETHKILDHVAGGPGDREDRFIVEKAMRWLGFIQGGLWSQGFYSIEDMKNHNR